MYEEKYEEIKKLEKRITEKLNDVERVYIELYKKNLELYHRVEELEQIKCQNIVESKEGKKMERCEYLSKKSKEK